MKAYYATNYRAEGSWHRLKREPTQWHGACVRARSQFEFVSRGATEAASRHPIRNWLDIGAGYGCLLDEAKQRGVEATAAVESEPHSRARLRRQGHKSYDRLTDVKGRWDVISFSHLLEHVPSPPEFLKQINEIVSQHGHVFCEVPNELHLEEAANDAPHLVFFTLTSLSSLFNQNGFKVLTVQTCGNVIEGRGWDALSNVTRRIAVRLFQSPPLWLDRTIHPHFHYSNRGNRAWIRLLARRT